MTHTAAPFLGEVLNALQEEASKAVNKTENWTAVATLAAAVLGGLLLYGLFGGEDSAGFSFGETESPVAAPPEIAFNEVVTDETLARQQAELSRMQYNSRGAALIGLGPI